MGNMAHCRFENTLDDLHNCHNHMTDKLEGWEASARKKLIELCKQIAAENGGCE